MGRGLPVVLFSVVVLGAQTSATERFEAALELFQAGEQDRAARELQALLPALTDPQSEAGVEALHVLGAIARNQGRYQESIEWTDRAIAGAREISATLDEAEAYNTRGLALAGLGRYPEATESIRTSLELHAKRGDAEQEVIRLYNLGALAQMSDRYFDALRWYEDALTRLDRQAEAPWALNRRRVVLANLASLYQRVGRLERALDLYESIARGKDLAAGERAVVLANMGALYRRLGDPFKAIETYERAAGLAGQANDASLEAGVLVNRGIALALDLNRLDDAEQVFTSVIGLASRTKDPLTRLHGLLYRAETLRRAGRASEARRDFETALAGAEELRVVEERWKALLGLGRVAEASGDLAEAESFYRRSIDGVESLRARLEQDALREEFLAERTLPYDALIGSLLRGQPRRAACPPELCDTVLDLIGRQRARVLGERLLTPQSVEAAQTDEVREELVSLWKDRLDADAAQRAGLDERIDALEREYERLERTAAPDPGPPPLTVARAQAEIDPGVVVAVFWAGADELLQIWITRESAGLIRRSFGKQARLAVRRFAEAASRPGSAWRLEAETVGRILLGDAPYLEGSDLETLLIDQDPELHAIPWAALILPSGERLADRVGLQHVVLPKSLAPVRGPWVGPTAQSLEAFAFSEPGESHGLARLELAGEEVRSIASLLPGRAELHLEADARRQALDGAAPILHFAAHAVADDQRPELSRISLAPDGQSGGADYLFLGEIETLDLRAVRLAVLSACETERGRQIAGEGVESLSRAFLAAGADRVVAGLWRVPDRPTAALMQQFYARLADSEDPAEALRRAQLRIADAPGTEHPYYWAAFRLTGRTRGPVLRAFPWGGLLVATAVVFFAIGLWKKRDSSVPRPAGRGLNKQ